MFGRDNNMNHRQWKKKFKKAHGRNPYYWEDRKKVPPKNFASDLADSLIALEKGVRTIISGFYAGLGRAFKRMGEVFTEIGEAYENNGLSD